MSSDWKNLSLVTFEFMVKKKSLLRFCIVEVVVCCNIYYVRRKDAEEKQVSLHD